MQKSNELADWLRLWSCPTIGNKTFLDVLEHFPNLADFWQLNIADWRTQGWNETQLQHLQNPNWPLIEESLRWAEQAHHAILTLNNPYYPQSLKAITNPPPILFVKGNLDILSSAQIGMVGSRNPSAHGLAVAQQFAAELAEAGLTITSGLALGIDAMCHQGALMVNGKTIAVLGTGIEHIYPLRHQKLAEKICQMDGTLISEFPLYTHAKAENFPRRNRIISGLSLGVFVIEAALKSGSLITANYAVEQGREVFALPGSIQNPLTKGCHALIKQGAKLVENATDILEELNLVHTISPQSIKKAKQIFNDKGEQLPKCASKLSNELKKILKHLTFDPTPIDIIIERTQLPAEVIAPLLTRLELEGLICFEQGGYQRTL